MKRLDTDHIIKRCEIERDEKWSHWLNILGSLAFEFPKRFRMMPLPPFGGAIIRFRVSTPWDTAGLSIYLDAYNALGCMDGPYWEVYPVEGDTRRFHLQETYQLRQCIINELNKTKPQPWWMFWRK